MPYPIPLVPPVMYATFPSSFMLILFSSKVQKSRDQIQKIHPKGWLMFECGLTLLKIDTFISS